MILGLWMNLALDLTLANWLKEVRGKHLFEKSSIYPTRHFLDGWM